MQIVALMRDQEQNEYENDFMYAPVMVFWFVLSGTNFRYLLLEMHSTNFFTFCCWCCLKYSSEKWRKCMKTIPKITLESFVWRSADMYMQFWNGKRRGSKRQCSREKLEEKEKPFGTKFHSNDQRWIRHKVSWQQCWTNVPFLYAYWRMH